MRAVVVLVLAGVAAASSPTLTQELNYGKIPSDVSLIGKSAASGCNTQHEYNGVYNGERNQVPKTHARACAHLTSHIECI